MHLVQLVKREHLDKIFNTIEKQHNRIIVYSEVNSYQSTLFVNLLNEELGIHDSYAIDLLVKPCIEEIDYFSSRQYVIQFKISSKVFKKFINDSFNNCKILQIDKYENSPLYFKMVYNNKVQFTRKFLEGDNFQSESNLENGEYFNINLELEYIKPFSNTVLSEYFVISINNDHGVILKSAYNNICYVNIYTEIYRNKC